MPETVAVALTIGAFNLAGTSVAAYFAWKAKEHAKPVANGFTGHVKQELAYLRRQVDSHKDWHLNQG